MRNLMLRSALIAGATLALAACGGSDKAADNSANEVDANVMMDEPANDASAMEAASNTAEPLPPVDNGTATGNVPATPTAATPAATRSRPTRPACSRPADEIVPAARRAPPARIGEGPRRGYDRCGARWSGEMSSLRKFGMIAVLAARAGRAGRGPGPALPQQPRFPERADRAAATRWSGCRCPARPRPNIAPHLLWNLRAGLNVAALQCQFSPYLRTVANYNALLAHHNRELAAAYTALEGYFRRVNGRTGPRQFDHLFDPDLQQFLDPAGAARLLPDRGADRQGGARHAARASSASWRRRGCASCAAAWSPAYDSYAFTRQPVRLTPISAGAARLLAPAPPRAARMRARELDRHPAKAGTHVLTATSNEVDPAFAGMTR